MVQNLKYKSEIISNKFQAGKYQEAINELIVLLKNNENDFLWNLLGLCYQKLSKINKSIDCFDRAISINPKNIAAYNNFGISLKQSKRYEEAETIFNQAIQKKPDYINTYVNLGNLKNETYHFKEAINNYLKALEINKNISSIHFNLANVYQSLNKIEEAEKLYKTALSINKKFTIADHKLSLLKKYNSESDPHIKEMLAKIKNLELNDNEKAYLYFALGKAYEDISNYEKSFEYLKLGNEIKRKNLYYNIKVHKQLSQKIKKNFINLNLSKIKKNKICNQEIIFVLGMPRSGTTLVEQILASHSEVTTIGETNLVGDLIVKKIDQELVEQIFNGNDHKNIDLISNYLKTVNSYNVKTKIILDKTLINFWNIGFIKIFFPKSKIIHIKRNPHDNCLSIYKNIFESSEGWNYDELELAEYYGLYDDIMKFWKTIFKSEILDIQYEDLINHQEDSTKKMLEFCNLSWQQNCLKFHENKIAIKTISVNQANKPIYKTSINKSKFYKENLKKMFSKLDILN